jgi:hypothetical protein
MMNFYCQINELNIIKISESELFSGISIQYVPVLDSFPVYHGIISIERNYGVSFFKH